jgi:hypothetical protein
MAIIRPDPLSYVPIYLTLCRDDTELAICTGFLYRHGKDLYLVTNWHCFNGRDPNTKLPFFPTPNRVGALFIQEGELVKWSPHIFMLSNEDGDPLWYEHPEHGPKIDVGILPVQVPAGYKPSPINDYRFSDIRVEVSQDVFILGFPLGLTGPLFLPVWKRGTIATEPSGNVGGLPKVLVDTATRSGMSGSPVIVRYRGYYKKDLSTDVPSSEDWFGQGDLFLGVYSGRLGDDELQAQLGVVWKAHVIEKIIEGKRKPKIQDS